jgi:hypothetical protein
LPAGVAVSVDEHPCEPLASARREVHDQECELVGHVQLAQPAVELDAVDHLQGLLEQDVLGAQIAVDLAHEPTPRTGVEHPRVRHHERVRKALQREHPLDLRALLDDRQKLVEVLRHPPLDGKHRHATTRHAPRVGVEPRQHAGERDNLAALQLAALELRGQRAPLVVAPHLDEIVDRSRIVLRRQRQAVSAGRHRAHAEIQIGRQAAVQAHLLAAHLAPTLRRAVVEERQHERLLELVGAIARQEHPRDVRLTHIDAVRPGWVEAGASEGGAHVLRAHGCDTRFGGKRSQEISTWAASRAPSRCPYLQERRIGRLAGHP